MRWLLNIGLLMTVLPLYGVAYFYTSYFMEPQNALRDECLLGVELIIMYSLPLWLGVAGMGGLLRRRIPSWNLILSQAPMLLMAGAYILSLYA